MKTEFLEDYYKNLKQETDPNFVESLKKLIETKKLDENNLENLIKEVI